MRVKNIFKGDEFVLIFGIDIYLYFKVTLFFKKIEGKDKGKE